MDICWSKKLVNLCIRGSPLKMEGVAAVARSGRKLVFVRVCGARVWRWWLRNLGECERGEGACLE